MGYPKVVVVGGGFGGLNAIKRLKKSLVDILVVDKANHHLFQPLLYQVATAALSPGDIALSIREILAGQTNQMVIMGEAKSVDREKREVVMGNGDRYPFDYLILAPGASHYYFGHSEWEQFAPGLKTLYDAITIREKILLSFERAERCDSVSEAASYLRFIVIGGGPTGLEMAGAIAEIARKSLIKNFRNINPEHSEIYLIEGENQLLPTYPKRLAEKALHYLENMGVRVLLNTRVTNVTEEGVYFEGKWLRSPNIIWAAGNKASPLLESLKVPLDRSGRVIVQSDLSIPGDANIFVIGDAAAVMDPKKNQPLPGIAPVAIQQGRYVANLIRKSYSKRKPFVYFDRGTMATIGKAKAVGMMGPFQFSGYLAWLAWCFIHIFYLIGFPNRIVVLTQWIFWYFTNQRRIRLITRSIGDESLFIHE